MRRLLLLVALAACDPGTTRPALVPSPETANVEMRAAAEKAIESLARALQADSVPVTRLVPRDGWLESGWFDLATRKSADARALGDGAVRVRAWTEPSRVRHVLVHVQVQRRVRRDPARPEEDLVAEVPAEHPVAQTVARILAALGEKPGLREVPEDAP